MLSISVRRTAPVTPMAHRQAKRDRLAREQTLASAQKARSTGAPQNSEGYSIVMTDEDEASEASEQVDVAEASEEAWWCSLGDPRLRFFFVAATLPDVCSAGEYGVSRPAGSIPNLLRGGVRGGGGGGV